MQPTNSTKYAGLILAAGASTRMGTPKPLLHLKHSTLLEDQVNRLSEAGCDHIIVVCGASADNIISAHQNLSVSWVINSKWETGSFSSLKAGVTALADSSSGCLILPVDTAGVPKIVFETLIAAAESSISASAIIPTHKSRGGHPVWLSKQLLDHIKTASPESRLDVILREQQNIIKIEVESAEILRNINTPEEWSEFLLQESL